MGFLDTCALLKQCITELDANELEQGIEPLLTFLERIEQRLDETMDDPGEQIALLSDFHQTGWPKFDRRTRDLVDAPPDALDATALGDLRLWSERLYAHLSWMKRELDTFMPWWSALQQPPKLLLEPGYDGAIDSTWQELVDLLSSVPAMIDLPQVYSTARSYIDRLAQLLTDKKGQGIDKPQLEEALTWCSDLDHALQNARISASGLLSAYQDLAATAHQAVEEMDFGFLFDPKRKVFWIGYNVMAESHDNSYYDLLASEARVASLVAIAKGDVPQSHWLHMSRPLARVCRQVDAAVLEWDDV